MRPALVVLLASGISVPVTYTTLNPSDMGTNITLSGSNLIADGNYGLVRSVKQLSGKVYFESILTNTSNSTGSVASGVAKSTANLNASLAYSSSDGWAMWGSSPGAISNSTVAVSETLSSGDVIGHAVDVSGGKMWLSINGTWIQGSPSAGTSPVWTGLSGNLYAAACPWSGTTTVTMRFNPSSFSTPAPSGFSPVTA